MGESDVLRCMTAISMRDVSKHFDDGNTVANYRLNLES